MRSITLFGCVITLFGCSFFQNLPQTLAKTEAAEVTLEKAAMPAIDQICSSKRAACDSAGDKVCESVVKCAAVRSDVAKGFIMFHLFIADAQSANALGHSQDAADALAKAVDLFVKIRAQLVQEGVL